MFVMLEIETWTHSHTYYQDISLALFGLLFMLRICLNLFMEFDLILKRLY